MGRAGDVNRMRPICLWGELNCKVSPIGLKGWSELLFTISGRHNVREFSALISIRTPV